MSIESSLRVAAVALALTAVASNAAETPAAQKKEDDAFSLFQENSKSSPSSAPAKQSGSSKPAAKAAASGGGGTLSIYCSGTAQQYTGPMATFSDTFEFRTILNFGADKHQVVNVMKGKIFRSGSTYDLLELPNDVVVLGAESAEPKWKISTVKLDLAVGKLTGDGRVDLSSLRGRLRQRMNEMSPASGESIPEGGLDDSRSVKLDGTCTKL